MKIPLAFQKVSYEEENKRKQSTQHNFIKAKIKIQANFSHFGGNVFMYTYFNRNILGYIYLVNKKQKKSVNEKGSPKRPSWS